MKSAAVVLIVLCLACVTRSDSDVAEEYGDPADPSERLVSALTEVDTPAPGLAGMGVYSIFMAVDEVPKFHTGVLGVPPPAAPPQMRELVRRGLTALPVLIRHLGDKRPTKLTIEEHHILMNRRFGDEYDPRIGPACDSACTKELIKREQLWAPINGAYQVKIGDVCFVLIGQIVNRNLNAVRYQPSGNLYVNSPVVNPSLAEKVRADWVGLDAQGHKASLLADLKTRPFPGEALVRLRFYYPNAYATLDGDDARTREKFEAEEKKARERKAGATTR